MTFFVNLWEFSSDFTEFCGFYNLRDISVRCLTFAAFCVRIYFLSTDIHLAFASNLQATYILLGMNDNGSLWQTYDTDPVDKYNLLRLPDRIIFQSACG